MTTYTTRAAAKQCGVSHQTISKHAHRLQIPVEAGAFQITDEDIENEVDSQLDKAIELLLEEINGN